MTHDQATILLWLIGAHLLLMVLLFPLVWRIKIWLQFIYVQLEYMQLEDRVAKQDQVPKD